MTLALAIVSAALLVWSTREDVASTRAAREAGAAEGAWAYVLAGEHWAMLRWAVGIVAAGLVLVVRFAAPDYPLLTVLAAAFACVWSAHVFRVAARNRQNARGLK